MDKKPTLTLEKGGFDVIETIGGGILGCVLLEGMVRQPCMGYKERGGASF